MARLESTIVGGVLKAARDLGWWAMKNHGNQFSVKGLPDVLCIKKGRAVWMEVKRPGQKPTAIQVVRMRELASHGCSVAVVTSAEEARAFLGFAE